MRVEGEGETKCKGTKRMGQNEWDEVNLGRNDRVPLFRIFRQEDDDLIHLKGFFLLLILFT